MWETVSAVRKSWRHNSNHAAQQPSTEWIDIELFGIPWLPVMIVLAILPNEADLFRL